MNVGEYGNFIRIDAGEDISGRNNTLTLKSPIPVSKTITITHDDGLEVGTQNITTPEGEFLANQYVEYKFKEDDIFISGIWEARLFSQSSDEEECKISDVASIFEILP